MSEVRAFTGKTYAESTKASYRTHLRTYIRFCFKFGLTPVPASQVTILSYIAFLARSLKPTSIANYINIVRLLHRDAGLANPLEDNFEVRNLQKGIARELGSPPKQALPVTCEILVIIRDHLCFLSPIDVSFWAACLTGMFGFLRKSTLLPKNASEPGRECLLRGDLEMPNDTAFSLHVRRTKTIQCGERVLIIPYCACPDSLLCPVSAMLELLQVAPPNVNLPLFSYRFRGKICWWSHGPFVQKFRDILEEAGFDPTKYSGHSFRRGGATLGFKLGLSILDIKTRGDWASAAVESYISMDADEFNRIALTLVKGAGNVISNV